MFKNLLVAAATLSLIASAVPASAQDRGHYHGPRYDNPYRGNGGSFLAGVLIGAVLAGGQQIQLPPGNWTLVGQNVTVCGTVINGVCYQPRFARLVYRNIDTGQSYIVY